jgi:hypothetical protein
VYLPQREVQLYMFGRRLLFKLFGSAHRIQHSALTKHTRSWCVFPFQMQLLRPSGALLRALRGRGLQAGVARPGSRGPDEPELLARPAAGRGGDRGAPRGRSRSEAGRQAAAEASRVLLRELAHRLRRVPPLRGGACARAEDCIGHWKGSG